MISSEKRQRLQHELDKIIALVAPFPMSPRLALKIYRCYGDDTIARLTENPYTLARDVFGIGDQTARRIANAIAAKCNKQFSPNIPTKSCAGQHQYCGPGNGKLSPQDIEFLRQKLHTPPVQTLPAQWHLNNTEHWTLPDLKRAIKWWFNVGWAHDSSYRTLLKKCGLIYCRQAKVFVPKQRLESVH